MINYDTLHEGDTVTKPAKAALKLMYKDMVIDINSYCADVVITTITIASYA